MLEPDSVLAKNKPRDQRISVIILIVLALSEVILSEIIAAKIGTCFVREKMVSYG